MSRFLIILLQFHPWAAILYDDVVENYDADENDEDPVNEQYPDNKQDLENTEFWRIRIQFVDDLYHYYDFHLISYVFLW